MTKPLFEISGFPELQQKLKQLGNDKTKRREVEKLLGQVANPTVKAAKSLTPVSAKPHQFKTRRKGGKGFYILSSGLYIKPGTGRRSIGKKTMRKSANPMITVSPRSTKRIDGFYLRQFVIPGTVNQESNPFIEKAYEQTKGGATADAEKKVVKYIQKQIDRLSK